MLFFLSFRLLFAFFSLFSFFCFFFFQVFCAPRLARCVGGPADGLSHCLSDRAVGGIAGAVTFFLIRRYNKRQTREAKPEEQMMISSPLANMTKRANDTLRYSPGLYDINGNFAWAHPEEDVDENAV